MGFTLPKNYRSLSIEEKEEWTEIKRVFDILGKVYHITKGKSPVLKDFSMINEKEKPVHVDTYIFKKDSEEFKTCIVQYRIRYNEASVRGGSIRTATHKYIFGFKKTEKDFGKAYLRPETIGDKISEFFQPIELDINGLEKFNRRYYLLSNNKEIFLSTINRKFLEFVAELKNLEMEFNGRNCLFRFNKAINLTQTKDLCSVGIKISELHKY